MEPHLGKIHTFSATNDWVPCNEKSLSPRIVMAKSNQTTKGAKSDIRQAGTSLEASGEVGHEIFSSLKIGICIVVTHFQMCKNGRVPQYNSRFLARLRIFPPLIPAKEMRRSYRPRNALLKSDAISE